MWSACRVEALQLLDSVLGGKLSPTSLSALLAQLSDHQAAGLHHEHQHSQKGSTAVGVVVSWIDASGFHCIHCIQPYPHVWVGQPDHTMALWFAGAAFSAWSTAVRHAVQGWTPRPC